MFGWAGVAVWREPTLGLCPLGCLHRVLAFAASETHIKHISLNGGKKRCSDRKRPGCSPPTARGALLLRLPIVRYKLNCSLQ